MSMFGRLTGAAPAAALAAAVLAAGLLGAWGFQYIGGLAPCPLCLLQRWPYYIGIPLGAAIAIAAGLNAPRWLLVGGLGALAVTLLVSTGFGVFHSGVEWKLWNGPDCSATGPTNFRPGDLMAAMRAQRIVLCDEAAWRFAGISLAGYNAMISAGLFILVTLAGLKAWRGAR
jgi:disulfide bond formation protein DsbB